MIRAVALVTLVLLLVLVLYLPSAHPPERFVAQLRSEHLAATAYWGADPAYRMLDRALRMQAGAAEASPIPGAQHMPHAAGPNEAVAVEMAHVSRRLFDNPYFRSVDAVLMLASYRLAALLEWLPWMLPWLLVAGIDGAFVRTVRAKEFLHHDPEIFAIWCSLLIVGAGATTVLLVLPWSLHPVTFVCIPIAAAILLGRAVAHFHRRA